MSGPLPDMTGPEQLPATVWREFGARLREVGLDPGWFASMWQERTVGYEGLQWPVRLWRARTVDDPAARLYRLFCLRDPVGRAQAAEALGARLLDAAVDAGLLSAADGEVVSPFDLRFFHGTWVLCDDVSLGGDAVFGVGMGNAAFLGALPRGCTTGERPVMQAADVGCGGGAVSMWMSRFARRILATDINPRALRFVRINAALNGIDNIEVAEGDLVEPLGAESFDLLVAQPPFVPCPPGAAPATYRLGGPLGTELPERLLVSAAAHLTAGGRAVIVFERPVLVDDTDDGFAVRIHGAGRRTLVALGDEVNADAYSVRYALPQLRRRDLPAFQDEVTDMRDHLHAVGIRGMRPAVGVVELVPGSSGWTELVELGGTLWGSLTPGAVDRLVAARDLLTRPLDATRPVIVRVPEGSLVVQRFEAANDDGGGDGSEDDRVRLILAPGSPVRALEFSRAEWTTFQRMQCSPDGAAPGGVAEGEGLLTRLVRAGLVDPMDDRWTSD